MITKTVGRQEVVCSRTGWKEFLSFLDGFSLDGEIDDAALKIKTKTEELESKLLGNATDKTSSAAAPVDGESALVHVPNPTLSRM